MYQVAPIVNFDLYVGGEEELFRKVNVLNWLTRYTWSPVMQQVDNFETLTFVEALKSPIHNMTQGNPNLLHPFSCASLFIIFLRQERFQVRLNYRNHNSGEKF